MVFKLRHNALENREKRIKRLHNRSKPNTPTTSGLTIFCLTDLADGRFFKTLSILDEFTRECLGIRIATSILSQDVITFLSAILQQRSAPVFLRSDNGSEFTADSVQTWLAQNKLGPAFIPPGQPWKNSFIESFHDKFRDECLRREWFQSLLDAQVVIEDWRLHYNTQRPHSSLDYKTPADFAAQYTIQLVQTLIPVGHKN